jgi:gas vesicle protein GvpL/GvpF
MKEATRRRLSELILEELSEKIKRQESLRRKLEAFTDLPVEKVAEAILKQFEYLLSSDLRELIVHLIEQEVQSEESSAAAGREAELAAVEDRSADPPAEPLPAIGGDEGGPGRVERDVASAGESAESIMEHFGPKEPFPSEPMDIELAADDWFYIYGFSYAPDSTGKGQPVRKLALKGIDGEENIFIVDYGDVRFYMHRMNPAGYTRDNAGKPTLSSQKASELKYNHERILNVLRGEDVLVPVAFWTVIQGHQNIITVIEDRYVNLLRALIDVHDIVEWDVDVLSLDEYLLHLPAVIEEPKGRPAQRDLKHPASKGRDIKLTEKVIFREKNFAQEIHNELLLHAMKAKVDYMIRLDGAIMDDWKSILSVRYSIGKEKRRVFCQAIVRLQEQYGNFRLMFRMTNPSSRFALLS